MEPHEVNGKPVSDCGADELMRELMRLKEATLQVEEALYRGRQLPGWESFGDLLRLFESRRP